MDTELLVEQQQKDDGKRLVEQLDQAFAEFGWERDLRGWHATDQQFTHTTPGVRADRVVCHGDAPRVCRIHGHGPVLWTSFTSST